jgi:hypothetical protein
MAGGQVVGGRVQVKRGSGAAARREPAPAAAATGIAFIIAAKAVAFADGLWETRRRREVVRSSQTRGAREPARGRREV